jgi:hypothetical protein
MKNLSVTTAMNKDDSNRFISSSAREVMDAFSKTDWEAEYVGSRQAGKLEGKYGPCMVLEYREGRHSLTLQSVSPARWDVTVVVPSRILGFIPNITIRPFRVESLRTQQAITILSRFLSKSPSTMNDWMKQKKYDEIVFPDASPAPVTEELKPVSKRTICIAFALLSCFICMTIWGYQYLLHAKDSVNWPSVEGVVTTPRDYEYSVCGVVYSSRQTDYKGLDASNDSGGCLRKGSTTVYYDPSKPSRAVLNPGYNKTSYWILFFGMVGILFCGIGLVQLMLTKGRTIVSAE